jgi:hypothetical protein
VIGPRSIECRVEVIDGEIPVTLANEMLSGKLLKLRVLNSSTKAEPVGIYYRKLRLGISHFKFVSHRRGLAGVG